MRLLLFGILAVLFSSCSTLHLGAHYTETYVRNRVVQLRGVDHGSCSGTQVTAPSGNSYLLTASHCEVLKADDGTIMAGLTDGRFIPRRILEVSPNTDLMLLEGMPNLDGVAIAIRQPQRQDKLIALTHGLGLSTYKSEGELIETRVLDVLQDIVNTPEEIEKCLQSPKNTIQNISFLGLFELKACVMHIKSYITIATTNHGSSGGFVGNEQFEQIGVLFAGGEGGLSGIVTLPQLQEFLRPY